MPQKPEDAGIIGNAMFEAYKEAEKLNREANDTEASLTTYIQKKIGYSFSTSIKETTFIYNGNNLGDRLDPKFYHPDHHRLQKSIFSKRKTKT